MENHPIPQDITGFQFKLIGDMTIKQFAYLAAGIVLGWIAFSMPVYILIKLPLAGFFVLSGVAAAFFPIAGRPLDTMIINYLKDLFNPTRYVYEKAGMKMWFPQVQAQAHDSSHTATTPSQAPNEKLKAYLQSIPQNPQNKFDEKESAFFQSLSSIYQGVDNKQQIMPQQISPVQSQPRIITAIQEGQGNLADKLKIPPPEEKPKEHKEKEGKPAEISNVLSLQKKLAAAKLQEAIERGTAKYDSAHKKVLELEKFLMDIQSQKQSLEGQIQDLQKKLDLQNQNVLIPGMAKPKMESITVRKIPMTMTKSAGLPIVPEFPNLITGIIKDPRGNPLPNILVEIKDNRGNPVRAFKTNIVGQFASATPLANGVFTIFFEDPKASNKFDQIEINVTGEIILPLEIISVDTREELRRSLFEQKN